MSNAKRDAAYEALLPLAESDPKEFLRGVNAWMGADSFIAFCEDYHGIDLDEDEDEDEERHIVGYDDDGDPNSEIGPEDGDLVRVED